MLTEQRIAALRDEAAAWYSRDHTVACQRLNEVLDAYEELQAELTDAKNDATVATAVANSRCVTHCGDCGSELSHLATIADKPGWLNIAVEPCEFCNEANLAQLQAVVDDRNEAIEVFQTIGDDRNELRATAESLQAVVDKLESVICHVWVNTADTSGVVAEMDDDMKSLYYDVIGGQLNDAFDLNKPTEAAAKAGGEA